LEDFIKTLKHLKTQHGFERKGTDDARGRIGRFGPSGRRPAAHQRQSSSRSSSTRSRRTRPGLHPAGPGLVAQQVQPHRLAHPATALRQQAPFLHRLVDRPASAAPRLVGSHTPIPLAQQTPVRPQNPFTFTLSSYRPPGDTAAQQPLQLGNPALQQQRSQPDILQATTLPVLLQVQRQQQPFQQQAGLGLAFSFGGQQNLGMGLVYQGDFPFMAPPFSGLLWQQQGETAHQPVRFPAMPIQVQPAEVKTACTWVANCVPVLPRD
jgi:hypothetical protein